MLSTHAARLERWFGPGALEQISAGMRDWYGPPIPVAGVPGGAVWAHRGGDFRGRLFGGAFGSALDWAEDAWRRAVRPLARGDTLFAGFPNGWSDIAAGQSAGRFWPCQFQKVGTTGVVGATNTLWFVGNSPAAGAAAGAAPGGTVPTRATTGAILGWPNPGGSFTTHLTGGGCTASLANTLLVYDRLFSVTKTMNSTATQAVTGVPSRYTNTTSGTADSAEGNFLMIECRTVLPATAHNWTVCLYTDQNGNTGATLPSVTGNSANIVNRLDQPAGTWFCPLAAGDSGILALTQMQCSAAVATGAIDFTIGHPIGWIPIPIVNIMCAALSLPDPALARVFDDACLALLETMKPATGATTYNGNVQLTAN